MEKVRNILSFDGSGIGFRWELKNLKPIDQSFFRGWLSWEHPYGNKDNYVLPEETVKRMPGHEFVENKDAEGGSKGSDFFKHYVYALNALVLIDNGLDVGLLGFAIEKSSKDLNEPIIKVITFYILPEYRNQGYGKQMQKMFVDYVQKNYPGLEIHGNIQTDVGEHMVNYRHNLLKDKSKHIITDSRKTGDSGKAELYSFPKQNMNLSWDVPDIEVENPITLYNGYTTDYSRCWISPMGDNFDALDDHTKSAIPLILKFYPNYEEEASGIMDAGNSEYNVKPQEYLLNKGWVRSNLQEGVIYFEVWNKGVIGNQKGFIIEFLRKTDATKVVITANGVRKELFYGSIQDYLSDKFGSLSWDIPDIEQEFTIGDIVTKVRDTEPAAIYSEEGDDIILDTKGIFKYIKLPYHEKYKIIHEIYPEDVHNKTGKMIYEVEPLTYSGYTYIVFDSDLELSKSRKSYLSKHASIPMAMLAGVQGIPFFYENEKLSFGRKGDLHRDIPDVNIDLNDYKNAFVGRAGTNAVVFWNPDYKPEEFSDEFDKLVDCLDRLIYNNFTSDDVAVIFANDFTPYTIDDFLGV